MSERLAVVIHENNGRVGWLEPSNRTEDPAMTDEMMTLPAQGQLLSRLSRAAPDRRESADGGNPRSVHSGHLDALG